LSSLPASIPLWFFVMLFALLFSLAALIRIDRRSRSDRTVRAELSKLLKDRDTALQNLPVGFYILVDRGDGPFTVERMTDRALDLLGVTRSAVESDAMILFSNLHPDDRDWVWSYNEKVRRAREPFLAEARFIVDGRQRWLRVESRPKPDGEVIQWFGYVADVTDRHEAESQFKNLFEQSPVAIAIHDPETGAILDANRAAWELYELDSLEALKKADLWTHSSFTREQALEKIRMAAAGESQRFNWETFTAPGRKIHVLVSLMPVVTGGQLRVFATVIDVSEMIAAQVRFEAIFQKSPVAAFVQDSKTGEVLAANEYAAKIYG
jgi:PAS domain S-box-containing protein